MYNKNKKFLWARLLSVLTLCGIALFIGVSLLSYNPFDPSWFYSTTESFFVSNVGGTIGAECAALLFYLFGGASFVILIPLLLIAYFIGCNRNFYDEWERIAAAWFLLLIVPAVLATYGADSVVSSYPGGIVGLFGARWLLYVCEPLGRLVFLPVCLTACFTLLLRFSYIAFVKWLVYGMYCCWYLIEHYQIIQRSIFCIKYAAHMLFVRPIVFFVHFVQSLLDGSAFNETGLLVPQEDNAALLSIESYDFTSINNQHDTIFANDTVIPNVYSTEGIQTTKSLVDHQKAHQAARSETVPDTHLLHKELSTSYALPHLDIFIYNKKSHEDHDQEEELVARAQILQDKLKRFGVVGEVVSIKRGPVVTLFEYQPDVDIKLSKIIALEDDLAMALQAMSIRILAPIPGKAVVGFEVANAKRNDVLFSQLVSTSLYKNFSGSLPLVLGKGTIGEPVIVDLARMPHLLIAGSTGSGKSVALNAILISLLCKLDPDQLKLILVDPKRLEFAAFADIAHLLFPIVTSPHHAAPVLRWVVNEMERRYEKMATKGARNSADYNVLVAKDLSEEKLPSIVVIIDELADLMLTAGRDIEDLITRITQMARAAGIHMIVATQRPSVDVITGLIKANFPSRISFRVASRIDSRTILDVMGADRLLGRGDMLFLDASTSQLLRVHGAYVSDKEIESVVHHIRSQRQVQYLDLKQAINDQGQTSIDDPLYEEICQFLEEVDEVSISLIQRKFRIGYNRSARIIDILESQGLIMPQDGGKMRKVIR